MRHDRLSKKLSCFAVTAFILTGCDKQLGTASGPRTDAPNVVLLTRIQSNAASIDVVQLREIKTSGCTFSGSLKPDFSITVETAKCGDIVGPANFVLGLSRAHTYIDADGTLQRGYAKGEEFFVADTGMPDSLRIAGNNSNDRHP